MDMPEHDITGSRHRIASLSLDLDHKIQFRNQISNENSDNHSDDNQSKIGIHDIEMIR